MNISKKLDDSELPFALWDLCGLGGAPAILHAQIGSTNSWVRENASQLAVGTLVLADSQTAGRGRFTRRWESPPGQNLYMTLFLRPGSDARSFPQATQLAALALARYGDSCGWPLRVKWPNDVLWEKRKVCGILSEMVEVRGIPHLILGMGINVNMSDAELEAIDRPAASLRQIAGHPLERLPILRGFLDLFAADLQLFQTQGMTPFLQSWKQFDGFLGRRARLVQDQTREGTLEGMREDGSLLFRTDDDVLHTVYSGDIEV